MHIRSLHLQTHRLIAQREFYERAFQLPITESHEDSFTLAAGATRVTFSAAPAGVEPLYHFAFNVPENQLAAAKAWLKARVALLPGHDGHDEFDFPNWNAHACYFLDPAGNVVEFIARHDLSNAAPQFSAAEIRSVSEIGLVVDDVLATVAALDHDLRLKPYRSGSPTFTAVGDANGLLIVVPAGRAWYPTNGRSAAPFPLTVELAGDANGTWQSPAAHCRITLTER